MQRKVASSALLRVCEMKTGVGRGKDGGRGLVGGGWGGWIGAVREQVASAEFSRRPLWPGRCCCCCCCCLPRPLQRLQCDLAAVPAHPHTQRWLPQALAPRSEGRHRQASTGAHGYAGCTAASRTRLAAINPMNRARAHWLNQACAGSVGRITLDTGPSPRAHSTEVPYQSPMAASGARCRLRGRQGDTGLAKLDHPRLQSLTTLTPIPAHPQLHAPSTTSSPCNSGVPHARVHRCLSPSAPFFFLRLLRDAGPGPVNVTSQSQPAPACADCRPAAALSALASSGPLVRACLLVLRRPRHRDRR
jgi:hypothetical protein